MMRKKSVLASLVALSLGVANAAFAANESAFWNAVSGDFNDAANWTGPSGSVVPNGTGAGTIGTNGGTGVAAGAATLSGTASVAGITVGFGGSTTQGTLVIDGGTFAATAGTFGLAGGSGGTLIIQNNGVANFGAGSLDFGRGSGVAQGAGTLLISSGTFSTTGDVYLGGITSSSNGSKGYASQTGGSVSLVNGATNVRIGASSASSTTAGGQGTYSLSDGTLNIASTSIGIILGDGGVSMGTFLMSGGTLNFIGSNPKGIDAGRDNGSGYLDFSGGVASIGTIGVGGNALVSNAGSGTATMIVRGTANVTMTSGNNLIVGAQQGNNSATTGGTSSGTVLVQNGALTVNSTAFIGSGTTSATGVSKIANGTLIVSGGVFAANTVQLGRNFTSSGYFSLTGGQANINNLNGPTDVSSTATISFTGGTLKLRDSALDLTNNGGTFSPGGSGGVGTTGFANKSYTQSSGTLWVDISAGTFDTVTTGTGTASIAGTIKVNTSDSLTVGSTFDVLVAALVSLDPGTLVTGTDADGHPFSASVVNSDTTLRLTVNEVPEPTVLSTGILVSGWLLRRRQRRGAFRTPRRLRCA